MNHIERAHQYAEAVLSEAVPACRWIKLACKRYLEDLDRAERDPASPYYYDVAAAARVCRFIELLPHTKGKWARNSELLKLEPWQCFFICNVFGWTVRRTGFRRFVRAELFVPRKNGKSALAAAIGLYLAIADGEFGAEVYSGATSEKQAQEVFTPAYYMAKRTPDLLSHYGVEISGTHKNPTAIYKLSDGSKFEPVIGKPGDGASPHGAIVDEYHEHKDDTLVDTMETGMGAREQPLLLVITTAGDNLSGPCYFMQRDAERGLQGVDDTAEAFDHVFAMIYTIDEGDEWDSLETLRKANPNYGVSAGEDYFVRKLAEAKAASNKQATFKTKHLNIWVGAKSAYFNIDRWQRLTDPTLTLEQFRGRSAYIGMDLASKVDLAALGIVLEVEPGKYVRFGKYYLPEARLLEPENDHYRAWAADEWITVTDGEMIDFRRIREDVLDLCRLLKVEELGFDPHQATMLVTDLMDEAVPVIELRASMANFSEPMKHLDAIIRAGDIRHNGDPVYTWMLSNVVTKANYKDEVYPRKERDESKIDGVVADLMAINRCMAHQDQNIDSAIFDPIKG